jgi:hypothetical protein
MLYQLSYASKLKGTARFRASLSLRSLPDARDNYLSYHKGKKRRNRMLPVLVLRFGWRSTMVKTEIPQPAGENAGFRDDSEKSEAQDFSNCTTTKSLRTFTPWLHVCYTFGTFPAYCLLSSRICRTRWSETPELCISGPK